MQLWSPMVAADAERFLVPRAGARDIAALGEHRRPIRSTPMRRPGGGRRPGTAAAPARRRPGNVCGIAGVEGDAALERVRPGGEDAQALVGAGLRGTAGGGASRFEIGSGQGASACGQVDPRIAGGGGEVAQPLDGRDGPGRGCAGLGLRGSEAKTVFEVVGDIRCAGGR